MMAVINSIADCPPLPEIENIEIRHCVGLPGYAIGEDGSLWSCRGPGCTAGWLRRKMSKNKDGYYKTDVRRNGISLTRRRCVLVATAWHGIRPSHMEIRHKDGTRDNDIPENLAWGTHQENMQDASGHGTLLGRRVVCGENHGRAKLTECDVKQIFSLAQYCTQQEIAVMFGIVRGTVGKILQGRKWKHLASTRLFRNRHFS